MPIAQEKVRRVAPALVLALSMAAAALVPAGALAQEPENAIQAGTPDPMLRATIGADDTDAALSAEDSAIIDKALAQDSFSFTGTSPGPLRRPTWSNSKSLDVSRTDRTDGSGTLVLKKPLPVEWDAKVGADLGLAANTSPGYNPNNPLNVRRDDSGVGAAWASLNVPEVATLDARVDPRSDQGRLGTTFKRSLPVGRDFTVSLQSGYSLTESMGTPQATASDIPLRIAPVGEPAQPESRVWGNENIAKLDILSTGTTLGAGLSSTSTDPVTHNRLSAEQKIYGPLGVTTAVTDFGRPGESKSVNARLKLTW
jgi:hypothetical protein